MIRNILLYICLSEFNSYLLFSNRPCPSPDSITYLVYYLNNL